MIVQAVLSVLLILFFFGFGLIFKKVFPIINYSISFTVLNGMIGVGVLGFLSAFFIPLNNIYEIILIVVSLISLIYHKNELKKSFKKKRNISLYFYVFSFFGLLTTVTYPYILDHFSYYAPTIKWLDYAGFVKGLSNFEWILAQNSFWHILQASVNESLDTYYRLNFSLFIIFNLYIFEYKYFKLLFFNALFLFFLNTPSPDLPVFILSILLINEYVNSKLENNTSNYLFYATILFVIKPISIVLLLFFGIEYLRNKEYKNLKDKNLLLIFFVALLFIFKGIIISANPIFPLGFASLESLSWASPKRLYELSGQNGKFIPLKDSYTFEDVREMNFFEYLKAILFYNSSRSLIMILILMLMIFSTIISFYKKKYIFQLLTICCWIKLLIMLFFSPQFRFLLDVLVVDGLIILILWNTKLVVKYSKELSFCCVFLFVIFIVFPFMTKFFHLDNIRSFSYLRKIELKQIFIPANYNEIKFSRRRIGNLTYNYPIDYAFIYSTKVPAISRTTLNSYLIYDGYPQQIDSTDVKKGFYFKEMNKKQKENIYNFLKEEKKEQVK